MQAADKSFEELIEILIKHYSPPLSEMCNKSSLLVLKFFKACPVPCAMQKKIEQEQARAFDR